WIVADPPARPSTSHGTRAHAPGAGSTAGAGRKSDRSLNSGTARPVTVLSQAARMLGQVTAVAGGRMKAVPGQALASDLCRHCSRPYVRRMRKHCLIAAAAALTATSLFAETRPAAPL